MANNIKQSADGLALQVTREARDAGLATEDSEGNTTSRSDVYVYGFDDLLVVIGTAVGAGDRAELVATAARDTGSVHKGSKATIAQSGKAVRFSCLAVRQPDSRRAMPETSARLTVCCSFTTAAKIG